MPFLCDTHPARAATGTGIRQTVADALVAAGKAVWLDTNYLFTTEGRSIKETLATSSGQPAKTPSLWE